MWNNIRCNALYFTRRKAVVGGEWRTGEEGGPMVYLGQRLEAAQKCWCVCVRDAWLYVQVVSVTTRVRPPYGCGLLMVARWWWWCAGCRRHGNMCLMCDSHSSSSVVVVGVVVVLVPQSCALKHFTDATIQRSAYIISSWNYARCQPVREGFVPRSHTFVRANRFPLREIKPNYARNTDKTMTFWVEQLLYTHSKHGSSLSAH